MKKKKSMKGLITEKNLDSSIFSSELLPKGYVGEFRRDRNNSGRVMIVTKDYYTITDLVLQTTPQNETELVWATITTPKLLSFWVVILMHGVLLTGKLD